MKNVYKLTAILIVVMLALSFVACTEKPKENPVSTDGPPDASLGSPQIQEIKSRGFLRVGVNTDVPLFGYLKQSTPDSTEIIGLEIDIARAIGESILGEGSSIEFHPVTIATRGQLLDSGAVDIVIATFTITDERRHSWNFTTPYFTDSIGFLVLKDLDATKLEHLDDMKIGVIHASTTKDAIEEKAKELGIEVDISEYQSSQQLKVALINKDIDAFSVDKSVLLGYVDDDTVIIDESFKPQKYGIATKIENRDLAAYCDAFVQRIKADGTLEGLIEKWGLGN
jgi:putative glutamine transport system substrate-binding protein